MGPFVLHRSRQGFQQFLRSGDSPVRVSIVFRAKQDARGALDIPSPIKSASGPECAWMAGLFGRVLCADAVGCRQDERVAFPFDDAVPEEARKPRIRVRLVRPIIEPLRDRDPAGRFPCDLDSITGSIVHVRQIALAVDYVKPRAQCVVDRIGRAEPEHEVRRVVRQIRPGVVEIVLSRERTAPDEAVERFCRESEAASDRREAGDVRLRKMTQRVGPVDLPVASWTSSRNQRVGVLAALDAQLHARTGLHRRILSHIAHRRVRRQLIDAPGCAFAAPLVVLREIEVQRVGEVEHRAVAPV